MELEKDGGYGYYGEVFEGIAVCI